ncbi:response regulator [Lacinutrix sp. Hel_I_90]|uniref:response regulator n=1 Tax=Lacinutrix sp. Hel_I_90 TaxID=1249999 RepID=UPI0005C918B0|nr:response regulator [Lacinutrix sp. Hel_I_90]
MEQRTIRILMTDDHPMIIEGYQNTLLATKKESQNLIIDVASNADESIKAIKYSIDTKKPYDIYFFDVSIPASSDGRYQSGIDLAAYVNDRSPQSKVIILTMFEEAYRITKILNEINPEGFLIKSDLTASELSSAFQRVLNHEVFYSSTVNTTIRKMQPYKIDIDSINHEILYLISTGIKTKDIAKHVNMSLSAVEKRKKQLKIIFAVDDGKDETLMEEAKSKGFIS